MSDQSNTTITMRKCTKQDLDEYKPDGVNYDWFVREKVLPALEGSE